MLKAEHISWIKDKKNILDGIDLKLAKGEKVGIIGPNGSGKSSLLKILSFLETPTSGNLWFQGRPVPKQVPLDVRRKIAVVFQESLLLDTTVYANVASGLKIRGFEKAEIHCRVEQWLERFGILHLAKQQARSLSGGEAQRVSLTRAFVLEPDIIFLDEPFSALDAPMKEALVKDLTVIFAETGTTTVLVSHDFQDIERLTERTVIMLNGKIAAEGTAIELLNLPTSEAVGKFLSHWKKV